MRTVSLSLLLALAGLAEAATTPTLRVVAVGRALNWPTGDQNLALDVRERGVVTLTVDRPGFDSAGYRARLSGEGDEQYGPGAVTTTYRLTDAAGRVLLRHTVAAGQVSSQFLFSAELPPGRYRLTFWVTGAAKRGVGLSVAGPVEVSATSMTSTVQGRQWMPVNVFHVQQPVTLRLYNGDSAGELELRVRSQDGKTLPLPSGARERWSQVPLPVGSGVIEARQGAGARQWSKSFSLILQDGWGHVLPQVLQVGSPAAQAHTVMVRTMTPPVQVIEVQDVRAVAREVTPTRSQVTKTVPPVPHPWAQPQPLPDDSTFIGPVRPGLTSPTRGPWVLETVQQGQDTSLTGKGLPVKLALVSHFLPKAVARGSVSHGLSPLRFDSWPVQERERHLPSSLAAPTGAQTAGLGSELMLR